MKPTHGQRYFEAHAKHVLHVSVQPAAWQKMPDKEKAQWEAAARAFTASDAPPTGPPDTSA